MPCQIATFLICFQSYKRANFQLINNSVFLIGMVKIGVTVLPLPSIKDFPIQGM